MTPIDLHMHSTYSDGTLPPEAIVKIAKKNGVKVMSLTDHDTVAGIAETFAAAQHAGIQVIPGIELSVHVDDEEVHVLGYSFDWQNIEFQKFLIELKNDRRRRMQQMLLNLQAIGISLTEEDIQQQMTDDTSPGRPHVARALVAKGVIKNVQTAFDQLLKKGKPGYAKRQSVSAEKIIQWIHALGGTTSVAHPGLIKQSSTLQKIITLGVDALEVYHPDHPSKTRRQLARMANQHGIGVTLGCDYHGTGFHNSVEPGKMNAPEAVCLELLKKFAS
ncbi:MAG: PHP domain-containing protein [Deltaproteobacteria bacterium]|nr:PHP domain-containing protein [Deltaproteobacteria bacterium]